jgi:DNA-binding transcriptional MerR regulator
MLHCGRERKKRPDSLGAFSEAAILERRQSVDAKVITQYKSKEVCRIVGIGYPRLDAWSRRDNFFKASIEEAQGRGSARLWSFIDMIELASIIRLRAMGVSLQKLKKAKNLLASMDLAIPWTFLVLNDLGDLTIEVGEDRVMSLLTRPGQYQFIALNVGAVAEEIELRAAQVIDERKAAVVGG